MDHVPKLPENGWWLSAFLAGRQVRLCLLILAAVALLPPEEGLGVELCMMKRLTGAPCPGCGMTRSGSNLLRGHVRRAINYHPFGLVMHPLLLGLAAFALLPGALRRACARRLLPWQRALNVANVLFWVAFFAFGLARWAAVVAGLMSFPPDRV